MPETTRKVRPAPKADFILQQPADMPIPDLIAKGKEAGMDLTPEYVRKVRQTKGAGAAPEAAPAAAPSMKKTVGRKAPPKRGPGRRRAGGTNKAEFVRRMPANMAASEVVKAAIKEGIDLDADYVYKVRHAQRQREKEARSRVTAAKAAPVATVESPKEPAASADAATRFRKLVLELGFARSRDLLQQLEKGLSELIAGR